MEKGVLVAGPPSSGKTTFLRDIARSLSLGRFASGRRVAIVDERGELGGFDLGPCADILRGYPKETGLEVALRVLSRVEDIGFCELTSKDVVRHPLVQKIVQAYENYEKAQERRSARKDSHDNQHRR